LSCIGAGSDVVSIGTKASHFFLGISRDAFDFLAATLHVLPESTHRIASDERETEYQHASALDQ
jgi:hypothetical protein